MPGAVEPGDGLTWSGAYPGSQGYAWSEGYPWSQGFAWTQAYVWSENNFAWDAELRLGPQLRLDEKQLVDPVRSLVERPRRLPSARHRRRSCPGYPNQ